MCVYIYIFIYLLLLYNSSILDIEHSPYHIALGSTHAHKVILVTTNTLIIYIYIIYIYIFKKDLFRIARSINTPQDTNCTATCPLSRKLFKLGEPDMQDHCWRSRDELIRDVLLWIPTHGRAKAGRPARTYIQQLCEDTGCCPEDLPRAMNDREEWQERVRDIRAASTI